MKYSVSRQFVSWRVTKQTPDHFGGSPRCLFSREKSLLKQGYYLTAGISGANQGRRLKVLPAAARFRSSISPHSWLASSLETFWLQVWAFPGCWDLNSSPRWPLLHGGGSLLSVICTVLPPLASHLPGVWATLIPYSLFSTLFISFNWEVRSSLLTTSNFSPGTITPADMLVLFISFITYLILFINYIVFGYIDVPYFILYYA